jgi:hypothetical protein
MRNITILIMLISFTSQAQFNNFPRNVAIQHVNLQAMQNQQILLQNQLNRHSSLIASSQDKVDAITSKKTRIEAKNKIYKAKVAELKASNAEQKKITKFENKINANNLNIAQYDNEIAELEIIITSEKKATEEKKKEKELKKRAKKESNNSESTN